MQKTDFTDKFSSQNAVYIWSYQINPDPLKPNALQKCKHIIKLLYECLERLTVVAK